MAVVTSSEVVNTGYAVLALIADAIVLFTLIFFLVSRGSGSARERWGRFRDAVTPYALQVAWIVAVLATFGSLFLQYEEGLQPCDVLLVPAHLHVPAFTAPRHRGVPGKRAGSEALFPWSLDGRSGDRHLPLPARARSPMRTSVCSLVPGAVPCNVCGHQYLRIHLGPLPVNGCVSAHHHADIGCARQ